MSTAVRGERRAIEAGLPHAGTLEATTREVLDMLASNEAPPDAPVHGALAALLMGHHRERLLPFWLELGGPGFATAAAIHERRLVATHARKASGFDLGVRWIVPRAEAQLSFALDAPTWETLAKAFRRLKKSEREAAQAEVRRAREGAHFGIALWADGIALLPEESAADGARVSELSDAAWRELEPWIVGLLPALGEASSDAARPAIAAMLERASLSTLNRLAPHAKLVVEIAGAECAYALTDLLASAHQSSIADAVKVRAVAVALATLDDPLVVEFFEKYLESRLIGTVAAEFVKSRSKSAPSRVARATEIAGVAAEEKKTRSLRAKKAAKKVATGRKKLAAASNAPEASLEDVPWVLREPPWHSATSVPPLPRAEIGAAIPFEEKLHLLASDRDDDGSQDRTDPLGMLVHDGLAAVPALLREMSAPAVSALRRVESPRVAERMVALLATPRRLSARSYFEKYPDATAHALVPMILGPHKEKRGALAALLELVSSGKEDAVHRAFAARGPVVAATASAIIRAAQLCGGPAEPPDLFGRFDLDRLPPVLLAAGGLLPRSALDRLIELCALLEPERPYAGVEEVRSACDSVSLDTFMAALVETWGKSKSTNAWIVRGAAALGGPQALRLIVKQVREWAREQSTRERAIACVQALEAGGLHAAPALVELAQKGSPTIVEQANDALMKVAKRERMSMDELADLAVPSLDLDGRGRATLDLGPRQFEVVLSDDLTIDVFDSKDRKIVTALRAQKTDDPTKAHASLERLKSLKKTAGALARGVASRFERAMVVGRTWRGSTFEATIVSHPILSRVARRLVWQSTDAKKVATTFRVAEDGTFADASDTEIEMGPAPNVRIVHPLDLAHEERSRWGGILADYEIIPPFPQMVRELFAPTDEELAAEALSRFRGRAVTQMAIQGRLLARGWEKQASGGVTHGYSRRFAGISAYYRLVDPIDFADEFENETSVGEITFSTPLREVPAIAFSEAAYDLHVLGAP